MYIKQSFQSLSSAPHRMFFFGGAVQSILIIAWWFCDLAGRYGGFYTPINWTASPTTIHSFLMIYGFFPFFIFGFLMTTFPRWMNGEEVERKIYLPAFLLLFTGILLYYIALFTSEALVTMAQILYLFGWAVGVYALFRVYWRSKHPDKRHATITAVVLLMGWLLLACSVIGGSHLQEIAKIGGVWVLLLPVFFSVSHRMIPFFSANAIPNYKVVRPTWALVVITTFSVLHGVLEMNGGQSLTWVVDLPMAIIAFYLTISWRLRDSLSIPILAMLHIGFAWFGIAMAIYGVQSFAFLITGQLFFGRAALHALTIGYFTSIVLAMVTRVTLGHSGRSLILDNSTWVIFIVFQAVPMLRIFSEFPRLSIQQKGFLYLSSAVVWLICFSLWAYKFLPIYWERKSS
jgi:uncharacterized protein involved in response to NO